MVGEVSLVVILAAVSTSRFYDSIFLYQVTGAEWPLAKAPVSPCPTLKVIGFVTSILDNKESLERQLSAKPKTMQEVMNNLAVKA